MNIKRRRLLLGAGSALAGLSVAGAQTLPADPPAIFDAHFHIFDPRFPIRSNDGYTPPAQTVAGYLDEARPLGIKSGVVVASSFQGYHQAWLKDALTKLGSEWVGVTQVPKTISDAEIIALTRNGVRGVRFDLFRGDDSSMADIIALSKRVHDIAGWHLELYVDALLLKSQVSRLSQLPTLVIDHLGMSTAGLPVLLELVAAGVRVKASGFGRVVMDVPDALEQIARINPNALMFGSDMPSTRAKRAFQPTDIDLVNRVLGRDIARKVLWENGREFYQTPLHSSTDPHLHRNAQ